MSKICTNPKISLCFSARDLEPEAIHRRLVGEISQGEDDFFGFEISPAKRELIGSKYAGYRFAAEAKLGAKRFERFQLAVSVGDRLVGELVSARGPDWLDFAGIPSSLIRTISREQQFAKKIHGYTLPREEKENTRVKDLVDLCLLVFEGRLDLQTVSLALKLVFNRRDSHLLPLELPLPPAGWVETFVPMAKECDLEADLNLAYEVVSQFFAALPLERVR